MTEARQEAPAPAGVAASAMREERKVVTVLAADLVGSTPLGERLDPEEVRLIVGDAVARMVAAVEDVGGTVKELAGDGILALFGAPVAHEEDPERAVRAGLRIARDIGEQAIEVERGWGVAGVSVRVGVCTGPVVLGPVGGGQRVEYGATGDAVNTAARLQSAAAPGTVLVAASTQRLVERAFVWSEPRSFELKGKAEPVAAFEVEADLGVPARSPGGALDAAIVGRDRELALAGEAARVPLRGRFEQNLLVPRRLHRFGAGQRMDYDDATPEALAQAIVDGARDPADRPEVASRPLGTDGARRAAAMVAELL